MNPSLNIDQTIRQGVIESLPEAKQIQNKELREKVYTAWALSLQESGYRKIEEMPQAGRPGYHEAEIGNQTDHLRGVTRLSVAIARELMDSFEQFEVDMDEVIAGGLCHDLGKPFEFRPENQERWKAAPHITGLPSIRHTVYGVHIALMAGLPEKIAHIAGAHSLEGEHVERSLVATIVHHADSLYWRVLRKAGIVE